MMERDIINTVDQLRAAGGGIAIMPAHAVLGGYFVGWKIYRLGPDGEIPTDVTGPWHNYKRKHFYKKGRSKPSDSLNEAKAWVADHFGFQGPWARNPMRDYVPADINKRFPIRKGV